MEKALRLFKNAQILKLLPRGRALDEASAHATALVNQLNAPKKTHKFASLFSKPEEDPGTVSRRALLRELDDTLAELRYARNCFENASDPEIVEACVYEIKSAEARYSFLLRKAKETGTCRNSF